MQRKWLLGLLALVLMFGLPLACSSSVDDANDDDDNDTTRIDDDDTQPPVEMTDQAAAMLAKDVLEQMQMTKMVNEMSSFAGIGVPMPMARRLQQAAEVDGMPACAHFDITENGMSMWFDGQCNVDGTIMSGRMTMSHRTRTAVAKGPECRSSRRDTAIAFWVMNPLNPLQPRGRSRTSASRAARPSRE